MTDHYILDGRNAVPCDDVLMWAKWYENNNHIVAAWGDRGDVYVSTVFLSIDHGFGGVPLLFETMIFGGPHHQWQDRYSTWQEAAAGHNRVVANVILGKDPDYVPEGNV